MAGVSLKAFEEKKILLLWFLSKCERMDSNCICIFFNNSQGITIQDYLVQKYFYFWTKFLVAKAAAMFTIQRHSSAVKAPGKASVLENFLWAKGNFILFWRSITQNCCDLWFCCAFSKHMEKLLPSQRWSYLKLKCLLRAMSLETYPHRSNVFCFFWQLHWK